MRWLTHVVTLIALLTPSGASAYVLERAESGAMVHWSKSCITWWMEASGCSTLSPEETRGVLRASFQSWDSFDGMYIDFEEGGVSCVDTAGLDDAEPLNVAMWRQGQGSWPYPARVVGLTTLTFDKETGEIVDADMEFNEEDFDFSHDRQPFTYDLQHAVTHEVGHILGLGHSAVRNSVMYETAGPEAWDERQLALDDKEGVSTNHGLDNAPVATPCGLEAPQGTTDAPVCPDTDVSGCAAGGRRTSPYHLLCLVACVLFMIRRRRPVRIVNVAVIALMIGGLLTSAEANADTCRPYRVPGGQAIYWTSGSVTLAVDPDLPEGLDKDDMLSSVMQGLEPWSELACVTMEIEFRDDGDGFSECPGEVLDDALQCVYWVLPDDEWLFGTGLIAVTLVHHNAITGEIVDTDMAINGTGTFSWSAPPMCDIDTADHDLPATLTHEFGHFFGLDHSSAPQSVMEAATGPGDCDKRTLEEFDRECLCAAREETQHLVRMTQDASTQEPADVVTEEEDTAPPVKPAPPDGEGCSQTQHGHSGALILLSLLWCAYPSKRRQRSRPRPAPVR
jgi:hypothetical protein